jgi:hypothetical protein
MPKRRIETMRTKKFRYLLMISHLPSKSWVKESAISFRKSRWVTPITPRIRIEPIRQHVNQPMILHPTSTPQRKIIDLA